MVSKRVSMSLMLIPGYHRRLAEIQRRGGDAWQAREDDPRNKAQSSLHFIFPLFRDRRRPSAEAARIRKHQSLEQRGFEVGDQA